MSIQIRQPIMHFETFIVAITVLLFLIFLNLKISKSKVRMRPHGRRTSDIDKPKKKEINPIPKKTINYRLPVYKEAFQAPIIGDSLNYWWISLSTHQARMPKKFQPSPKNIPIGLNRFCENHKDAQKTVSPIVRKIFQKYRRDFEHKSPINLITNSDDIATLTWIAHNASLNIAVFGFLDECLNISKELDIKPSLEIHNGCEFHITVYWNKLPKKNLIKTLISANQELELVSRPGHEGVRLWLSYTNEKRKHFFDFQRVQKNAS